MDLTLEQRLKKRLRGEFIDTRDILQSNSTKIESTLAKEVKIAIEKLEENARTIGTLKADKAILLRQLDEALQKIRQLEKK